MAAHLCNLTQGTGQRQPAGWRGSKGALHIDTAGSPKLLWGYTVNLPSTEG